MKSYTLLMLRRSAVATVNSRRVHSYTHLAAKSQSLDADRTDLQFVTGCVGGKRHPSESRASRRRRTLSSLTG